MSNPIDDWFASDPEMRAEAGDLLTANALAFLQGKFPSDALRRLKVSTQDYYSTHGQYLPELARLLLHERVSRQKLYAAVRWYENECADFGSNSSQAKIAREALFETRQSLASATPPDGGSE